jgi:hypothetical protein
MLEALSKLYKHPKAATLYLTIPSRIAMDSTFVFKEGNQVSMKYDPETKTLIVSKKQ